MLAPERVFSEPLFDQSELQLVFSAVKLTFYLPEFDRSEQQCLFKEPLFVQSSPQSVFSGLTIGFCLPEFDRSEQICLFREPLFVQSEPQLVFSAVKLTFYWNQNHWLGQIYKLNDQQRELYVLTNDRVVYQF